MAAQNEWWAVDPADAGYLFPGGAFNLRGTDQGMPAMEDVDMGGYGGY